MQDLKIILQEITNKINKKATLKYILIPYLRKLAGYTLVAFLFEDYELELYKVRV